MSGVYRSQWGLRSALVLMAAVGLLFATEQLGALAPPVPRDTTSSVATITAEQLSALPGNRDLLDVLSIHNRLRSEVGARPLRWNAALAANAQRYANVLAQTGQVVHASRVGRENERENIVVGPRSGISPVGMTQIWVREKAMFRPGVYPGVCVRDWSTCSHYTQIIWPSTTDVGCGYARGRFDALVCRYSPPGNKDGVALGPTIVRDRQIAEGLCTGPGGLVIECGNNDGEGGGVVEDGGGGDRDTGIKEEVACAVNVNVHRPMSSDPAQTVIPEDEEFARGATTLRNDDSDWRIGEAPLTLPIVSLPTDVTRDDNDRENDLVQVDAINPQNLPGVYVFAFPTHVEASRNLRATVNPVGDGRQADPKELAYYSSAAKGKPVLALPLLVPPGAISFWLEGKLGGQYRIVIGKLANQVHPGLVHYDSSTNMAYAMINKKRENAFICEDQATVTAAVVDIFQMNTNDKSKRLTGFDVYWGGRPHFRADVWPGRQGYSWGGKYRLGAAERDMPGTAVDDEMVASMARDVEDDPNDSDARVDGPTVAATGTSDGDFRNKGRIEGGFQIHSPEENRVPTVNRDSGNRYPHRVTLQYMVNGETLVRAEYLEIILPKVVPPERKIVMGDALSVESGVNYEIHDMFDRPIKAERVDDYLYLYGAGIKAWEALAGEQGRVVESGPTIRQGEPVNDRYRDFLYLTNTGRFPNGARRPPVGPLGTAQRSQAEVRDDRMTKGTFQDTLRFTAPTDPDPREALWKASTGRPTEQDEERARDEAKARDDALNNRADPDRRYRNARERQTDIRDRRRAVPAADEARITNSTILVIPQDVIIQLRAGPRVHDLMVFEDNRLTVFSPYFFNDNKYIGNKTDPVFRYHLRFQPGRETSRTVPVNHRRPQ